MILAVDIGNSSSKLALFNNNMKGEISRIEGSPLAQISEFGRSGVVDHIIISDVSSADMRKELASVGLAVPVHILSAEMKLPFSISYRTPGSIGSDRLAAIAGAMTIHPGSDIMVIDAGTAVTYDLVTSTGVFIGGNISPGLRMRFNALNRFTGRLPLVDPSGTFNQLGIDTEDAIRSGVVQGLVFEINEYIRTFESKYENLKVILSGGDTRFLSEHIKFSFTFAPDLILEGLNNIMTYNA